MQVATRHRLSWPLAVAICASLAGPATLAPGQDGERLTDVIVAAQQRVVKIYGAGGFRNLEPYQSGVLISADGHIVTAWSYVLDTPSIRVTLDNGRAFPAALVGADPGSEIAVLKIEAAGLPFFDLDQPLEVFEGTSVLAFSNLFGVATGNEAASVQHGIVAIRTRLDARRGVFESTYRGDVYVVDAITNNPGAAGGALTDYNGRLVGLLGKELRNAQDNTWLNYAIPVSHVATVVTQIQSGVTSPIDRPRRAASDAQNVLTKLGILLIPDVVERTPPYVEAVRSGSPADRAGLVPDDLLMFLNGRLVPSAKVLFAEVERLPPDDSLKLSVMRAGELIELTVAKSKANSDAAR